MEENKEVETITNEEQQVQVQPTVQSVEPNNNDKKGNNKKLITIILIIAAGLCVVFAVVFFVFFNHSDKDDEDYNDEPEVVEKEDEDKKETTDDETKKEEKKEEETKKDNNYLGGDPKETICKDSKNQINTITDADNYGSSNNIGIVSKLYFNYLKADADYVAEESLNDCCNMFRYNFNNASEIKPKDVIGYIFRFQVPNLNINKKVLDEIVKNRLDINNFSNQIKNDEYPLYITEDGKSICSATNGMGGTNDGLHYDFVSSTKNNENNVYTFKYLYKKYINEGFKNDVNIIIKYKYDEKDGIYKLFYLNNDNNK